MQPVDGAPSPEAARAPVAEVRASAPAMPADKENALTWLRAQAADDEGRLAALESYLRSGRGNAGLSTSRRWARVLSVEGSTGKMSRLELRAAVRAAAALALAPSEASDALPVVRADAAVVPCEVPAPSAARALPATLKDAWAWLLAQAPDVDGQLAALNARLQTGTRDEKREASRRWARLLSVRGKASTACLADLQTSVCEAARRALAGGPVVDGPREPRGGFPTTRAEAVAWLAAQPGDVGQQIAAMEKALDGTAENMQADIERRWCVALGVRGNTSVWTQAAMRAALRTRAVGALVERDGGLSRNAALLLAPGSRADALQWLRAQGAIVHVMVLVLEAQLDRLPADSCHAVVKNWLSVLDPMADGDDPDVGKLRERLPILAAGALEDPLSMLPLADWSVVMERLREETMHRPNVAELAHAAVQPRSVAELRSLLTLAGAGVPASVRKMEALANPVRRCLEVGLTPAPFQAGAVAVSSWLMVHAADWAERLRLTIDLQLRDVPQLVVALRAVAPDVQVELSLIHI